MKWNPLVNGLGAVAYVWGLVFLINHISKLHHDTPDNLVGTAAAFSIFSFSAAVMGFLFFYRPVALLIENKKTEAVMFFFKTIAVFGMCTLFVVLAIV